jgi:hypothetical protein
MSKGMGAHYIRPCYRMFKIGWDERGEVVAICSVVIVC